MYNKVISYNNKKLSNIENASYKKLLRIIVKEAVKIMDAEEDMILYGTNHTEKKFLPLKDWDRAKVYTQHGKNYLGIIAWIKIFAATHIFKIFPVISVKKDNNKYIETPGIISFLLNRCNNFYENGIYIIYVPEIAKYINNTTERFIKVPAYLYNSATKEIQKSEEDVLVDTEVIRKAGSKNFMSLYIPNYGLLELNNINPLLYKKSNEHLLKEKMDQLINFVNIASFTYFKQKGKYISEKQRLDELNEKEKYLRELGEKLRTKENELNIAADELKIKKEELFEANTELTKEKQEKQELEKKLDQLEKVLEKTNKDRILKTIFHSLKGYLQTLQINKQNDNETREKIKNSTTTLHNSIKNLDLKHKEIENIFEELFKELALLEEKNQLLDKAIFKSIPKYIHVNRERLNGNMIVFSEEPVALSTVYSDTVDDFTSVLKMHNISALPLKTHIRALKLQNIIDTSLHDILIILFTNSIEAFLQAGELGRDKEIKCLTSQGKRNNKNFTVVRFIDNGLGVPDDLKEKIFERGFSTKKEQNQENTLTNKDLGNSGIGLDDIKSYMEAIGGFIREVGTYGEGAEFQLWFPEENQAEAAAKEETVAQKNIEQISELVHNKRILLAEDNDNIRESLANELRKFNLVVETASDGLHGYEMITQNNNYDLIITDIDMPDLKGNDMILKLYQNNYKVPFIFASDLFSEEKGLAFYNLRKPFRALGINEIPSFSKPLDMNALILKVEEILLKTVVPAAEEKN